MKSKERKLFWRFNGSISSVVIIVAVLFCNLSATTAPDPHKVSTETNSALSRLAPLDLKAGWWRPYEKSHNGALVSMIAQLKRELGHIMAPSSAVELRDEVVKLLDSYLQKRSTPLPVIVHSFDHNRTFTIEDLYKIKKGIEVSSSKLALKESLLDEFEQTSIEFEREESKYQKEYLELKNDTAQKLLLGLKWMRATVSLSITKLNKKLNKKNIDNIIQEYDLYVKDIAYAIKHLHIPPERIAEAKAKMISYRRKQDEKQKILLQLQQKNTKNTDTLHDTLSSLQIIKQKEEINTLKMLLGYEEAVILVNNLQNNENNKDFDMIYESYIRLKKEHDEVTDWVDDTEDRIGEEKDLFTKLVEFWGENNQTSHISKRHEKLLYDTLIAGKELDDAAGRLDTALGVLNQKLIKDSSTFSLLKEKSKTTLQGLFVSLFLWMDNPLFEISHAPVTAWDLLGFFITLLIGWYLAKLLSNSIIKLIPKRRAASLSSIGTIRTVIRTVVFGTMFLLALSNLGIDITKLTILISALSIGIGFGLQTIISNFVSGIILIFEKSIKVGDYIELDDGTRGVVQEINIRSTIINTYDNIDIVVPNSQFINTNVVNLTMKNRIIRVKIPFGVAYDSDIDQVKELISKSTLELPYTLGGERFKPQVWLRGLGDSSLECELIVWIKPEYIGRIGMVKSSYTEMILHTLKAHKITIPFPQQDVRIVKYNDVSRQNMKCK